MEKTSYEKHIHEDPDFPFFFHLDTAEVCEFNKSYYHWHESIEILNCIEGSCQVILNGKTHQFTRGDTLIVDPFALHAIIVNAGRESGQYYCLIADKSFFSALDLPTEPHALLPILRDVELDRLFRLIAEEMNEKSPYWKQSVRAYITTLLIHLCRNNRCIDERTQKTYHSKSAIAAEIMKYLYNNFESAVTIDQLSQALGFNKYYLCHIFREITGESIVGYLNMLRCNQAKKLLLSGNCTVGEACEQSGFSSFSYFSKTYRRHFGHTPSADLKSRGSAQDSVPRDSVPGTPARDSVPRP